MIYGCSGLSSERGHVKNVLSNDALYLSQSWPICEPDGDRERVGGAGLDVNAVGTVHDVS